MRETREHPFAADEVMAYLDGELPAKRAAELVAHFEHCADCQRIANQFRGVSERLLEFYVEPMSDRVATAVLAAAEEHKAVPADQKDEKPSRFAAFFSTNLQNWSWRRWVLNRYVLGAACVAIVAFLVVESHTERPGLASMYAPPAGAPPTVTSSSIERLQASPGSSPSLSQLQSSDKQNSAAAPSANAPTAELRFAGPASAEPSQVPAAPMISRKASLTITATKYDEASQALARLAANHRGYVQTLDARAEANEAREVSGTLRVPANQIDALLADLRNLGHVEQETQSNDEVTAEYVDLEARIRTQQALEQRLIDLLKNHTGKLEDMLDAERELGRVRGEIESMQGQRAVLLNRVDYATVDVRLNEQYVGQVGADSFGVWAGVKHAFVTGFDNWRDGSIGLLVFLLTFGPSIIFWSALVLVPGWFAWRKFGRESR